MPNEESSSSPSLTNVDWGSALFEEKEGAGSFFSQDLPTADAAPEPTPAPSQSSPANGAPSETASSPEVAKVEIAKVEPVVALPPAEDPFDIDIIEPEDVSSTEHSQQVSRVDVVPMGAFLTTLPEPPSDTSVALPDGFQDDDPPMLDDADFVEAVGEDEDVDLSLDDEEEEEAKEPRPVVRTDDLAHGLGAALPATSAEAHSVEAEESVARFDASESDTFDIKATGDIPGLAAPPIPEPDAPKPEDTPEAHPIDVFEQTFSDQIEVNAETLSQPPSAPPILEAGLVLQAKPPPLPEKQLRFRERPQVELGKKTEAVIGIDLGTTYSCAAIVTGGEPRVLPARSGGLTIPSVVRYVEGGKTIVGASAARNASDHASRTILGSKRLMGRAFTSPVVQEVQHHFAYAVVAGRDGEAAIRIDDEIIGLEDVAATILQEIRESVGQQLKVNRAVITCPAHFTERQREAVRKAGALAGFHVERVLNEPTAAALNYQAGRGLEKRRTLVYDLGGGTFDVSLLEVEGDKFEVLATGGDTFLGGMDFDACIVEILAEAFLETEHIDPREDPAAIAKLFEFAERAKRDLSYLETATVKIDHLVVQPYAARKLEVTIRRARIDKLFEPLVGQTLEIVRDVVQRAGLELEQVDDIILVGGQSRSPIVGRAVTEMFGRKPMDQVDPEQAVALGAARYAASIDQADSITLIDALPLSIGVGLAGGRYKKLLPRDTRLPAKRSYQIRTTRDDQKEYELAVFQGEEELVTDNEPLGMLYLEDLPPGPRGAVAIEVTMEVNAECILQVHAREMSTNREVSARMVTRGTTEEIRVALGLPPQPTHEELERRRAKVRNRPKGVWRWITGLFRRG